MASSSFKTGVGLIGIAIVSPFSPSSGGEVLPFVTICQPYSQILTTTSSGNDPPKCNFRTIYKIIRVELPELKTFSQYQFTNLHVTGDSKITHRPRFQAIDYLPFIGHH